ncbi:alpha/beta hydrolase [Emcibacter sp.]|uniref:alpha/beta hydrolase n=1 Tax=Emcibacter sp. TaxID=1979954 RepID=UPI003A8F5A47
MPRESTPTARADRSLRPEIEQFLIKMAEAGENLPPLTDVPFPEARRLTEEARKPFYEGGPDMCSIEDKILPLSCGNVRIRIYSPSTETTTPALFYIHGGGWVLFSLDTHDRLMREYAARTGFRVIGIDYSHAPEKKYPGQLIEVAETILWCQQHADELDIDRERLTLGGDSAGGNLTIAACLKLREMGHLDLIKALVLNYGAFDGRRCHASYKKFGSGEYLLSGEEMDWFWGCYLESEEQVLDPMASPILANVTGLPPVYMVISDFDVLYDENMEMKKNLEQAGVAVTAKVCTGTTHSFLESMMFGGIAEEALDETGAWLLNTLN